MSKTKTIWKFPLEIKDEQSISMPAGAMVLSVQLQRDAICLWVMCDQSSQPATRKIRIIGTGHSISDWPALAFIGTVQMEGGSLVWHVFEAY